jgi:hypothetical protein
LLKILNYIIFVLTKAISKYNLIAPDAKLINEIASKSDFEFSIFPSPSKVCIKQSDLSVQVKYIGQKEISGMIIVAIRLPTGWEPNEQTIQELKVLPGVDLKRYELAENKVNFYFEDLPRDLELKFKFQIARAHNVLNIKPGLTSVYDYYEPMDEAVTQPFEIANNCN